MTFESCCTITLIELKCQIWSHKYNKLEKRGSQFLSKQNKYKYNKTGLQPVPKPVEQEVKFFRDFKMEVED